ncbi:Transcription regulator [contains diacylglycerol kinase catalytic domain] [uncultured Leptolyngbya sp.]|uniref:Transcription regulator [contains diacylglycerol kinase catalytic domain] n=1 Tax=uncultured Leptolyngbya sp. TaxID=332963 RepID=A0A6J4KNI0_9CYAN|nr:Transcription regulator [contains diacylglycerol kinase catalytic domain] [uncultured Leptolyngbya sp.]
MRRALFLVNYHSRKGQQSLPEAVKQLKRLGFELLEESTEHPEQLPELISRYRGKVDIVIIGGGDGTLNAAAAGLVETGLPLGILPLGTANDLARTLGIPTSIPQACDIIATGRNLPIDLGRVNDKYFFNVASFGLSTRITEKLTKDVKKRWGVFAYGVTALQVLLRTRPFRAELRLNGEIIRVKTVQVSVGNGRFYGGGMAIAHDATINDQTLDLYSLEIDHWWQIIPILPAMARGRQATWPRVVAREAKEVEVFTRRPRSINTDGEITTQTPARFRVIPHAISVMVPVRADSPGLS